MKVVGCEQTGNYSSPAIALAKAGGAQYYDPKISACLVVKRTRWLSVDPLAEKYTSLSSYVFSANSPLNIIDPDGRRIWVVTNETWEIISDGIRGLFGDQTPFLRDTESGKMLINPEFDASNLEPAQQELYNPYASLIENDNVDAYVQAVGHDEIFSDHAAREQSLSSEGERAYGRTFDDFFEDEEAGRSIILISILLEIHIIMKQGSMLSHQLTLMDLPDVIKELL